MHGVAGTNTMSKDHEKTVKIRRIAKVAPDHRGHSVWLGKVEAVELELVTTTALQKILETGSHKTRTEIARLAGGRKTGVLARETATGRFRILSDADLRKAAAVPPDSPKAGGVVTGRPLTETTRIKADALSLVSTQVLRKVVKPDGRVEVEKAGRDGRKDRFGGYDPYDKG